MPDGIGSIPHALAHGSCGCQHEPFFLKQAAAWPGPHVEVCLPCRGLWEGGARQRATGANLCRNGAAADSYLLCEYTPSESRRSEHHETKACPAVRSCADGRLPFLLLHRSVLLGWHRHGRHLSALLWLFPGVFALLSVLSLFAPVVWLSLARISPRVFLPSPAYIRRLSRPPSPSWAPPLRPWINGWLGLSGASIRLREGPPARARQNAPGAASPHASPGWQTSAALGGSALP